MTIHSLYKDFFKFLNSLDDKTKIWERYCEIYLVPNKKFLSSYWQKFKYFDLQQIKQRVQVIKRKDYNHLESLINSIDLPLLTQKILKECHSLFPSLEIPDIYLFVGFFSADGFLLELNDKQVLGFGLERFKDFKSFPLLVAHEYGHYVQSLLSGREGKTPLEKLISEGIAIIFSEKVFPDKPLHKHTFLSLGRLYWAKEHEKELLDLLKSDLSPEKLTDIFFAAGDLTLGIPPRTGYYLGYKIVKELIKGRGIKQLEKLIVNFDGITEFVQEKLKW